MRSPFAPPNTSTTLKDERQHGRVYYRFGCARRESEARYALVVVMSLVTALVAPPVLRMTLAGARRAGLADD